jgi:hypothetical protein
MQKRFHLHGNELPNTVTAKNTTALLLKEVIFILFDQNLPQGEN